MQASGVAFYLAGATWCPHTHHAQTDVAQSQASVWETDVKNVLQSLQCDKVDATHPACRIVHSYPAIVACNSQKCENILDGYFPDYPVKASNAIASFLSRETSF